MNVEIASTMDQKLLDDVLADEKYEWIRSYDIHIAMFFKYGKYDKDGNLKTPALVKNGIAIPISTKVVSSFNRLTDDVDVKLIVNKELWDEYSEIEKKAVLDNAINYLELKTDKIGEPLPIADDNDKVQLKLKHPDFYCEGFINMIEKYKDAYIPLQDARSISELCTTNTNSKNVGQNLENQVQENKNRNSKKQISNDDEDCIPEEINSEDDDINLDDIKL